MEEYEDMESDAFDAFDAPDAIATTGEQQHKAVSQNGQMIRRLELGVGGNRSGNTAVLKATSGNAAKWVKVRQEARVTIRAGKTAEAAVKHIGKQEL